MNSIYTAVATTMDLVQGKNFRAQGMFVYQRFTFRLPLLDSDDGIIIDGSVSVSPHDSCKHHVDASFDAYKDLVSDFAAISARNPTTRDQVTVDRFICLSCSAHSVHLFRLESSSVSPVWPAPPLGLRYLQSVVSLPSEAL